MVAYRNENLLPLRDAAAKIPGRPHVSTLWRWATHGVGRQRQRLETVVIGGRRFTSIEALERFITALSSAQPQADDSEPERTADAAERTLDAEWGTSKNPAHIGRETDGSNK